jgi:uncharacterized protein
LDYPNYDPQLDTAALDDAELESLDELLQSLPGEAVMNIEAIDGYLTALLVGPPVLQRLSTGDWLPPVWGGDGTLASTGSAPFASQKQRKRAAFLVLRHLRDVQRQLAGPAEDWQPIFSVAETKDSATGEWVDAEDWCAGFLHATVLDPEAWGALFEDATLGPALVPIALMGGDGVGLSVSDVARLADPAQRDELSRAVVDAVLHLQARTPRTPRS